MHLIVDIRASSPLDPMIARYASNWVDLWRIRHPEHRVSYIHFSHQECPENGQSVLVHPPTWWGRGKRLSIKNTPEIFRCINFSKYPPYDSNIETISHVYDHADILYPRAEPSGIRRFFRKTINNDLHRSYKIIVPSLSTGQDTVSIANVKEENIEIIPYINLTPGTIHQNILAQLSITGSYWIYDGKYGSEANIPGLLQGYKTYRELGGTHLLLFMGQSIDTELGRISDQIRNMELTGFVRIIGALDIASVESIYTTASGWIYIGAYYASGPRIELARSHHIPLLISNISSLQDYHENALTIHPNHLSTLGKLLLELEKYIPIIKRKISNSDIMLAYDRILAERS